MGEFHDQIAMSNAELYLVLACFFACLFIGMVYLARRDERMLHDAEAIVRQTRVYVADNRLPTLGFHFRKRRFMCMPLVLLALGIGLQTYLDIGWRTQDAEPSSPLAYFIGICLAVAPLVLAVRQWIYEVVIFENVMQIRSFRTKTYRFDQMSDFTMQTYKGMSYCEIQTRNTRTITVPADLVDFLTFVRVLSQKMHRQA